MKTIKAGFGRVLLTLAMGVCAVVLGQHLWSFYMDAPWTRDAHVRADIVRVAPDVSGLVKDVLVADNEAVEAGAVLFRIDPQRFKLAVREAEAQVVNARVSLGLAQTEFERYRKLVSKEVASVQQRDEAQSRVQQAAAEYQSALAARDLAKLNLERTDVRAPVAGTITNFSLRAGNYATAGGAVGALVDKTSLYVAGYFEETKLPRIHPNAPVRIEIMGEQQPIEGHVASIAAGIEDRERSDTAGYLANVAPTFSWVRLAQRIPVRIAIDRIPAGVKLIAGRTATVLIKTADD
ncbi:efflux RND transporter periplasmic adaptor subunit [Consotaella salsifontis]|uniref:RND family efflux transporter, MFP subunit n=1 Tax=Consotaella salsifontis TaxID=1365950 RepID=A0A1T4T8Z3_9HYPH|nr:HlyD family secretion protein [Consotaella salsifontis]SKA36932.1 RND family efflux transporter, MFP subunit [Consotaella salsifontis]